MDLKRMALLATVVESGSMRRAARQLGLTPSAISQQIRQLERENGVTLLRRSTRHLALTDAGQAFYEGCAAMLDAARSAHERLAALHEKVIGELSISAPVGFATTHLVAALQPLLAVHPGLRLRLVATDDQMDLSTERIDLAIAIGTKPPASSLVRRHLATWENVLVAAPSYLAARGKPKDVEDLPAHDFVALPPWHHPGDVLTGPAGQRYRLQVKPRVTSNNQHTIRQLALAGFGLSFHVVPEIADELAKGRLVRVLPKWSTPALSVDALMPPRSAQPAKVRAALAALETYLAVRRRSSGTREAAGSTDRSTDRRRAPSTG
jgi:LysR family transcriptional regulator, transcriptional activator for aaeXAB operon